jgi:hypothetical protein
MLGVAYVSRALRDQTQSAICFQVKRRQEVYRELVLFSELFTPASAGRKLK